MSTNRLQPVFGLVLITSLVHTWPPGIAVQLVLSQRLQIHYLCKAESAKRLLGVRFTQLRDYAQVDNMPNEVERVTPERSNVPDSSKEAVTWGLHEPQLAAVARAEDLPRIAAKVEQAAMLLAEAASHLEKVAPKHKPALDETRMRVSDVGLQLRQSGEDAPGTHRVLAPIPGVVMQHGKKIGHEVKKGDVVLILEAMKMENPIMAPVGGKVVALPYGEGQKVAKGAVLAIISMEKDGHVKVFRSGPEKH